MQHARLWPFGLASISKELHTDLHRAHTSNTPASALGLFAYMPTQLSQEQGCGSNGPAKDIKQLKSDSRRTCLCWPVWGCSTSSFMHNHEDRAMCCKRDFASNVSDHKNCFATTDTGHRKQSFMTPTNLSDNDPLKEEEKQPTLRVCK